MKQTIQQLQDTLIQLTEQFLIWSESPEFYTQLIIIAAASFLAVLISPVLKRFMHEPSQGKWYSLKVFIYSLGNLLFAFTLLILLGIGTAISSWLVQENWLVQAAQGLTVVVLLYSIIKRYVRESFIGGIFKWVGIPVAILIVFGKLDEVAAFFDSISFQLGNIKLSLLAIMRGLIFGSILFWLGRHSNKAGQKVIRNNPDLDLSTKELFAKLFEVLLFIVLFILLLQVVGINLTALAVLGGAVGVGLGFGLQQIAANFISGIIILMDKSITVGDHIELEDGSFGILRELRMRYAVIETYEGKEIMVPNETFITSVFTNWSHKDDKQRYDFTFSVAYSTDLHALFKVVKEVVASHPKVISGDDVSTEEQPDAEIDSFGDSGINILVEFWMHGVDDGKNRVDADLKLMIWDALKEHGFQMPFPQREVRILGKD